jgi:hypothetical protein
VTLDEEVVMMNHHGPLTEETLHDVPAMVFAGPTNRQATTSLPQTGMPGGATEEDASGLARQES